MSRQFVGAARSSGSNIKILRRSLTSLANLSELAGESPKPQQSGSRFDLIQFAARHNHNNHNNNSNSNSNSNNSSSYNIESSNRHQLPTSDRVTPTSRSKRVATRDDAAARTNLHSFAIKLDDGPRTRPQAARDAALDCVGPLAIVWAVGETC